MRFHNKKGFTVAEFLISLAIVVILATMTVFELRSARRGDELRSAAQQLQGDIRAMQSQAIAAKDVQACVIDDVDDYYSLCELYRDQCGVALCETVIPEAYGVHMVSGSSTYVLYTDINPMTGVDSAYTDEHEMLQERSLVALGSTNVYIDDISNSTTTGLLYVNIGFGRQHGDVEITDPLVPPAPEPVLVTIRLKHAETGKTLSVEVNRITGRVSIL